MSSISMKVAPPFRGQGGQVSQTIALQSVRATFSWGGSPGTAGMVFVDNQQLNMVGCVITLQLDQHFFAGICRNDTSNFTSRGNTREIQFADMREFLAWDYVKCTFNMPIRRFVNGIWKKRYWHIYPNDWATHTITYTDFPLPAYAMVGALFTANTVGTGWSWDLTGNGLFPFGLMNAPVYSFDCSTGVRLDAALNDISERGGLVYTHQPASYNLFRLVWMRKGYGLIPFLPVQVNFPDNSDDRRVGLALSGNATNINVVGERNQYLVLNVPLAPDWNRKWEAFMVSDQLAQDLYKNATDPDSGLPYANFPDDPEHWKGANAAKVRALQITVGEYVALRNARAGDGDQFADFKKFSGRSRMDMPATLYIEQLLYRAYVPDVTGIVNVKGQTIGLDSVNILDAMPCRVTYDPKTGTMAADTNTLADGNGVGIVKGTAFGQDMFDLVKPERVTDTFYSATNRLWGQVPFQIDDSGEGQRFVIFDQPVFTSENLLTKIGGYPVLNANPTLNPAAAQAALTFELEPFDYWQGTYPNVSRDRVEYVSGLCAEYAGQAGSYQEIVFANGQTARQKASIIAANLLNSQYLYLAGGYKVARLAAQLNTQLTTINDRVDVEFGPSGFFESVDFTTERGRSHFEPERDLDRKTQQNALFPGQAQLQQRAREQERFGAGLKSMASRQLHRFVEFLNGKFDDQMRQTRFDPNGTVPIPAGDTIRIGTPVFKTPVNNSGATPLHTLATYPPNYDSTVDVLFLGLTVRQGESANGPFYLQASGETLCWVKGPINASDPIGPATDYKTYATVGAYLVKGGNCGHALQTIGDASTKLILVNVVSTNSEAGDVWLP